VADSPQFEVPPTQACWRASRLAKVFWFFFSKKNKENKHFFFVKKKQKTFAG